MFLLVARMEAIQLKFGLADIEGIQMKYNHIGILPTERVTGEIDLPHLKMTVNDHANNLFGIQWQRYWEGARYPELVKTVPHVAFEADADG